MGDNIGDIHESGGEDSRFIATSRVNAFIAQVLADLDPSRYIQRCRCLCGCRTLYPGESQECPDCKRDTHVEGEL